MIIMLKVQTFHDMLYRGYKIFILQDHLKIPIVGTSNIVEVDTDDGNSETDSKTCKDPDRLSDQEILETINGEYFSLNESFDPGRYELNVKCILFLFFFSIRHLLYCVMFVYFQNVLCTLTVEKIDEVLNKLRQQHLVVSNQVLQMAASASSSLSVAPLNPTNRELEALPLIDKDCLIEDFEGNRDFLQTFSQLREDY